MNPGKDLSVDAMHFDVSRRDSHSPEVGHTDSDQSCKETRVCRAADLPADELSPEVIDEFRRRIAGGVYDAPATMHAVAVRLLESGDV